MKKMKGFQTFIAIALAVVMVLPCVSALAEGDDPEDVGGIVGTASGGEVVNNYNTGDVQTNASTVEGEVWVGKRGNSDVVEIQENGSEHVEEYFNLNPGGSYPDAENPLVTYKTDNPVTVNVDANIDSSDFGISVGTTATVNVSKDKTINAESNGIDVIGYGVSAEVSASSVDVTSGGFGIHAESDSNGSASVTVGNVTSTNIYQISNNPGIFAKGGSSIYGPGTATVTAETVTSENGKGVYASSYAGGTATVNVTGNEESPDATPVTATQTGVEAFSKGSKTDESGTVTPSTTTVIITGDVKAGVNGVEATSENGGQTNVTVTGNVTASGGEAVGAEIESNGGKTDVSVGGDITAEGDAAIGIKASAGYVYSGSWELTGERLNIDQTSDDDGYLTGQTCVVVGYDEPKPVRVTSDGVRYVGYGDTQGTDDWIIGVVDCETTAGVTKIAAGGSVTGDSVGIISEADTGSSLIVVEGSVTAEAEDGVGVRLRTQNSGTQDILVAETISGGAAGISTDVDSMEKATVTAWKIEGGEDGTAVVVSGGADITNRVKSSLNYIVKLAEGLSNSNVSTANGNTVFITEEKNIIYGNETDEEDYTYHTAVEDEEVSLTFDAEYDPDKGDTLNVLYNADDENSAMTQGTTLTKGIFTLTGNVISLLMNRGGGMKLAASVNHAHKYVSKVTEPTCTAQGYTTHTCSRCGDSYVDSYVDAKGHTEVTDAAVASTCTETGLTEGKHCSVCNEVLVRQEVVAAKGHTEVTDAAVAATCTGTGLTEGKHCSVCNEVLVAQEVVLAAGHEFEGQFTADKETHWYACKNCDAKKDEANHIPGTPVKENEQLAKNGAVKSYEEVTYCTVCGAELSRETILGQDAIHNPNAGEADIAEYESMTGNDIDLSAIPMPMDVSSDDDDVKLDTLANCPDALKETAKQELAALKRSGYKIDCGCVAWPKSSATAACTLKLSEKDVPDGAQIFVNGAAVQAELKDGYYYFEITLPAVVLVAHK